MKWYVLPPIVFAVLFFIIARTSESWAALGYVILLVASLLGLLLSFLYLALERYKGWKLKIWLQVLLGVAFSLAGFFILILLVRVF